MTAPPAPASFLSTRRGKLTLALLCGVQFLDVLDASIVNVALPSIQHSLSFSQQNLQWVLSGYVLTFGGFLLLGGRAADLLGRRRVLIAGVILFASSSLAGGVATNEATLITARLVQGIGAALMAPAALSIVTTSFKEGVDRHRALGVWGAMGGLGAAAGVFFGGVLSEGPGWRWVFYVNIPFCVLMLFAIFRLLDAERPAGASRRFDAPGAVLVTGGMLLLVYALIKAPDVGWASGRTIGSLVGAAAILAVFLINEQRSRDALLPLSIFRVKGLAAADATQMIAYAGFLSMFFFLTLYMQNVLHWSPIQAGAAYLPVTVFLGFAATISPMLFARVGTRPVIVAGALLAAGGIYYLSRVPVHGHYLTDLFPGLAVMALGLGAIVVGATVAANADVPANQAGLAAGLLNTSAQLGTALGLAIFSALATARTNHLFAAHAARPDALTSGYARALLASSIFLAAAALIALRTTNSRGEEPQEPPATEFPLEAIQTSES
jgi:EmrB/QacA subfamily drug resistance transporter